MAWERVVEALLDALAVVAPVSCAGCGGDGRAVCASCRVALTPGLIETRLDHELRVTSSLAYSETVRRVILSVKEQGRTDAIRYLAPALRAAVNAAIDGDVELTTVPTSAAAYRRRGYDPVRMMLRAAHLPAGRSLLRTVRTTERQKALDRDHRSTNLVDSMRARHRIDGRRILLVDDVLTTGATLVEAARAIRAGGGTVVAAVTLAATPRRVPASLGKGQAAVSGP